MYLSEAVYLNIRNYIISSNIHNLKYESVGSIPQCTSAFFLFK